MTFKTNIQIEYLHELLFKNKIEVTDDNGKTCSVCKDTLKRLKREVNREFKKGWS